MPEQTSPTPPQELPEVPGYELLGVLGRGGMGVVYKARHLKLKRVVALKMILAGGHAGEADLERFRTEAEAVARLQHPNVVQVFEVGEHGGLPFFCLEFCPGGSLEGKLNGTPLPAKEAAAVVEKLARGMHAAHEKGVIHRDLKPANVLIAEDGTLKITDFGLAKKLDEEGRTATGALMGTPSYMAPEQAGGKSKQMGPACDVYALGAILYECLTGRPPFRAATSVDTILAVISEDPVPVRELNRNVARDLETICHKCLQKEPRNRYTSAGDLADDLQRFLRGEPIKARRRSFREHLFRWMAQHPMATFFTLLPTLPILLYATAMIIGGLWLAPPHLKLVVLVLSAIYLASLLTPFFLWWPPRSGVRAAVLTALSGGLLAVLPWLILATGLNLYTRELREFGWGLLLYPLIQGLHLFLLCNMLGGTARFFRWLFDADMGLCVIGGLWGFPFGCALSVWALYLLPNSSPGPSLLMVFADPPSYLRNVSHEIWRGYAEIAVFGFGTELGLLLGSLLGGIVSRAQQYGWRSPAVGVPRPAALAVELQGMRRVLLLQGTYRFGLPGQGVRAAIEAIADPDRLEQLSLRVLETNNWRELLG